MENFKINFLKNNKRKANIIIQHKIFGEAQYNVDELYPFCDDERIGVKIKKQDIYAQINQIENFQYNDNLFVIETKLKKIKIICKK